MQLSQILIHTQQTENIMMWLKICEKEIGGGGGSLHLTMNVVYSFIAIREWKRHCRVGAGHVGLHPLLSWALSGVGDLCDCYCVNTLLLLQSNGFSLSFKTNKPSPKVCKKTEGSC